MSLVCAALNSGSGADAVKLGHLKKAAVECRVGDSFLFSCLWSSNNQMRTFMVSCNELWKMITCSGLSDPRAVDEVRRSNTWAAVPRALQVPALRRSLANASGRGNAPPTDDKRLEHEVTCDDGDPLAVDFDRRLRASQVGEAIKEQGRDAAVIALFLSTLAQSWHGWVTRRNALQVLCEAPGEEAAVQGSSAQSASRAAANSVKNRVFSKNSHWFKPSLRASFSDCPAAQLTWRAISKSQTSCVD